jgi:hypothetical protein
MDLVAASKITLDAQADKVTAGHANAKGWTPRRSQKEVRHHRTQVRG